MQTHRWKLCEHCGIKIIVCGKCQTPTCNNSYGTIDGVECNECEEAHRIFAGGENNS